MNERIKELAEQCYEDNSTQIDVYKFAELIVRECGQWFNDRLVVEPHPNLPLRTERNQAVAGMMKEYNEHFGVEQ